MNQTFATEDIQRPEISELRKLTPFSSLPKSKLLDVAMHAEVHQVKKREVLMNIGENYTKSLFLLKGNVLLEAADNRQRIIKHTDPSAKMPLSRLQPSHYKITTLTAVTYLSLDNSFMDELMNLDACTEMVSSHYVVEESSEENVTFSTQIVAHIYEDLHRNRLLIHSWHPVALQVSKQIIAEKENEKRISNWIMHDPVLTLKLLKAVHTYGKSDSTQEPHLSASVERLGIASTHKLTFMNLFRESSHPGTEPLASRFQQTWEYSILVAGVAKRLAQELGNSEPHLAETGGLLHNMGENCILSYAYAANHQADAQEIEDCIESYSNDINRMLLSHWNVFHVLAQSTADAGNLMFNNDASQHILTDIIVSARAIVNTIREDSPPQPPLPQIPAIQKLRLDQSRSHLIQPLQEYAAGIIPQVKEKLALDY